MADSSVYLTVLEALKAIKEHELVTSNRFVVLSSPKGFGNTEIHDYRRPKVQWDTSGHPFVVLAFKTFGCHHGRDKNAKRKQRKKFLMVYQTQWMKDLLLKYGSNMTMLDSTYKTTKYALPLFMLAVRTNVDHQVVCIFIVEDESVAILAEAIAIVKENNTSWKPRHYMTDCDEKEMAAMEQHFPEAQGLICDFHRGQAWHRLIAKGSNGVKAKKQTFDQLQSLAWASSEDEFQHRLDSLEKSELWKPLKNYMARQWLPLKEKWAQYSRTGELLVGVHTNNGLERLHGVLKNVYLKKNTKRTITAMVTILIHKFFPDKKQRYIEANVSDQGKKYAADIPEFLHGRPPKFIHHCMDRMNDARHLETPQSHHTVSLGNMDRYPSCTCKDFMKTLMPCRHMFANILKEGIFTWVLLPLQYRDSIYFRLDSDVLATLSGSQVCSQTPTEDNHDIEELNESAVEKVEMVPTDTTIRLLQRGMREKLQLLQATTYTMTNAESLKHCTSQLAEMYDSLCSKTLVVNTIPAPLPVRRRKKRVRRFYFDEGKQQQTQSLLEHSNSEGKQQQTQSLLEHSNSKVLEDLWLKREPTQRKVVTVNSYVLTEDSFHCLKTCLSDEVIDAYLSHLVGKYDNVGHINCVVATAVFTGSSEVHCLLRQTDIYKHSKIVCAVNTGHHWVLV